MGLNNTPEGTCGRHKEVTCLSSSLGQLSLHSKDDNKLSELEQSLAAVSLGSDGEEQGQVEDTVEESVERESVKEKVDEKEDVAEVKEEEGEVVEAVERIAKVEAGTDVKEVTKEKGVRVDEEEKGGSEEGIKKQDNKTDERKVHTEEEVENKEDKLVKEEEVENKEDKLVKKEEVKNKEDKLVKEEEDESIEGKLVKEGREKKIQHTREKILNTEYIEKAENKVCEPEKDEGDYKPRDDRVHTHQEDAAEKKQDEEAVKREEIEEEEKKQDEEVEEEEKKQDEEAVKREEVEEEKKQDKEAVKREEVEEEEKKQDEEAVKREEDEEEDVISDLDDTEEEDHSDDENEPDEEEEVDNKRSTQKKPKKKLKSRGLNGEYTPYGLENGEYTSYGLEYESVNLQYLHQDQAFDCLSPQQPSPLMYGGSSPQHGQTPTLSSVYPGMSDQHYNMGASKARNQYHVGSVHDASEARYQCQSYNNQLQPQSMYNQNQNYVGQAPVDQTSLQQNQLCGPNVHLQQDQRCVANLIPGQEQNENLLPDFSVLQVSDVYAVSQTSGGVSASIPMPDQQGSPYFPQHGSPQESEYSNETQLQEVEMIVRREALTPSNIPVRKEILEPTMKELEEVLGKCLQIPQIPHNNETYGKIFRKLGRVPDRTIVEPDENGDHMLMIAACKKMGLNNHTELLMAGVKRQQSIHMCCNQLVANQQCANCFNANSNTFHSSLSLMNHQKHTVLSVMVILKQPKVFVEYVLQYLREADIPRIFTPKWLPFYRSHVQQYSMLASYIQSELRHGAVIVEDLQ